MAAMAASLRSWSTSFLWSKRGTLVIAGGLIDNATGGHTTGSFSSDGYKTINKKIQFLWD
jgi:hypothetical protein